MLLVPHEIYLCMWNKKNVLLVHQGIYFYVCIKFDIQAARGDLHAVTSVVCLCTV